MHKVLVVSYFFPPVGGAGVQRVTKFVKYLGLSDWQAEVLTVTNPSVPLFDQTLLKDIPESVNVHKAKTLEPDYGAKQAVSAAEQSKSSIKQLVKDLIRKIAIALLQPDPQVLWIPAAYTEGKRIIKESPPEVIFASAPPFSTLVLGAMLSRKFNIPLVLDYRDEWDISNSVWENKQLGPVSLKVQQWLQNYALKSASSVIATTSLSVDALQTKLDDLDSKATTHCIYNGYDDEDFSSIEANARNDDYYTLSYVGTLWNLTSIEPLVLALNAIQKSRPEIASKIRLEIAGRKTADQIELLAALEESSVDLVVHDYLEHNEAVSLVKRSNGLVLLLSDMELARRVVPGKLFEYFATDNALFAIAPEGEVWKLASDYPKAYCCEPSDIAKITQCLISEVENFQSGILSESLDFDALRYERKQLTAELASCFTEISR